MNITSIIQQLFRPPTYSTKLSLAPSEVFSDEDKRSLHIDSIDTVEKQAQTQATAASHRPVRVLHAIRQGSIGGGESHVMDLVTHLQRSDYQSVVLAFTPGAMVDRLRSLGHKVHVIESTRAFDFSVGRQVSELLKSEEIDLIHIHGTRAFTNLLLPAKKLQIPIVYTIHGWSFHPDQPAHIYYARRFIEAYLCKSARQVITVSDSNHETGVRLSPNFRSVTIRHGIDTVRFDRRQVKKDLRPDLGIPADAFLLGFIARMTKQKQPLLMLKAFEKALQQSGGVNSPLHLLFVGDGELRSDAEALIRSSELLQQKVSLQSFRTDIPELLAACNVYCLPSLWEGLPIGLVEAMAMSLPCIATAVDGTCNAIQHEQNGILIQPGSEQALTDAILRTSADSTLCERIGAAARQTAEEQFSVYKMTARIAAVYENILVKKS
ncbi:glycosyltransferase family 4 protein [Rhodoflexus sp.]